VRDALARDLEAARFAADRAFRQYDATDPQNRLVAAELELRWNQALERVTDLQQRIDDHDRQRPAPTSTMSDDFTSLTSDLPTVWADPTTHPRLKKRIVRTLINEVIADIEPQAGEIIVVATGSAAFIPSYVYLAVAGESAIAPQWRSSKPSGC